jgi:hypothetical protein
MKYADLYGRARRVRVAPRVASIQKLIAELHRIYFIEQSQF